MPGAGGKKGVPCTAGDIGVWFARRLQEPMVQIRECWRVLTGLVVFAFLSLIRPGAYTSLSILEPPHRFCARRDSTQSFKSRR